MKKSRRKYSLEFKQEAVDLVGRTGKSLNQIAQESGIAQASLSRWMREAKSSPGQDNVVAGQAELRHLRKEVERLKMEHDILKKATAFFVKESQ
jgi:transposase